MATVESKCMSSVLHSMHRISNAFIPVCLQRNPDGRTGYEECSPNGKEMSSTKHPGIAMDEELYTPHDQTENTDESASGIENVCFSLDDEGSIEYLTDDALLNIFSFLSLVDRGRVASVCKRWKRITKESTLWTYINFWETNHSSCINNPWTNDKFVLRLLQTYASSGLRTIHLKAIGADILLFLRQHCPNVEVFSFWPPTWPPGLALDSKCRPVPLFTNDLSNNLQDILQIPTTSVKVQLTFTGVEAPSGRSFVDFECGRFTHALLFRLSRCQHLRHLTLANCDGITTEGVNTLTRCVPGLEELWLLNFKHRSSSEFDTLKGVLQCVATNLRHLLSFRFITQQLEVDFDEFFLTISKHGTLTQLWLGRGSYTFSEETFVKFCLNLPALEGLALECCNCVTDNIIKCIGQNLKRLILLNLLGSVPYTSQSLSYLQNHPTLRLTNVPGLM